MDIGAHENILLAMAVIHMIDGWLFKCAMFWISRAQQREDGTGRRKSGIAVMRTRFGRLVSLVTAEKPRLGDRRVE